MAPSGPPTKRLNLSSKPLKSFNWTKMAPNKVSNTIWCKLDDTPIHNQMGAEYHEFETLFAAKETVVKAAEGKNSKSTHGKTALYKQLKKNPGKEISFLDSKRSQNCSNL